MFPNLPNFTNVITYYLIAFILVSLVAAMAGNFGEASPVLSMLTPLASVLIMMLLVTRKGWSKEGWRSLGVFTAGLRGWWVAILFPTAVLIVCDAALFASGLASFDMPETGKGALQLLVNFSLGLLIGIALAFCEEIGWRGYMLPKLMGLGAVAAVFIVGFLHGMWHLPLILMTPYYHAGGNPLFVVPFFLVTLTLAGAFFGFLRLWTGSVWPVAIAHGVYNFVWGLGSKVVKANRPETMEYIGGESGIIVIAALIVTAIVLIPRLKNYQTITVNTR